MLTMEQNDIRNVTRYEPVNYEADLMNDILIIDDDPMVRHFLRRMLRIQGYTCTEVMHEQEAIDHLHAYRPRLIIADYKMLMMTERPLHQNVWDECNGTQIPVILMTRDDDNDDSEQAKRLGVDTVLCKPLDYRKLSMAVSSVLS